MQQCEICQLHKYETIAPFLQPIPIPKGLFEDIAMDFIIRLSQSKGLDSILVIVDRLSKYAHFSALRHSFTAKSIAELFVKDFVHLHGIPHNIISDRNPIFTSLF